MRLHENQSYFEQLILQTSDLMGIPETYIEKDYWVTYALKTLFQSDIASQAVFKGGTALVKCYHAIERFWKILMLWFCVMQEKQIIN